MIEIKIYPSLNFDGIDYGYYEFTVRNYTELKQSMIEAWETAVDKLGMNPSASEAIIFAVVKNNGANIELNCGSYALDDHDLVVQPQTFDSEDTEELDKWQSLNLKLNSLQGEVGLENIFNSLLSASN